MTISSPSNVGFPVMPEQESVRITLIDDEVGMRYIFAQHLRSESRIISEFSCGEDFFEHLARLQAQDHPHILLLDLNIPDKMDGLQILQKAKTMLPACEIVMLTAHGDTRNVVEAMRLGAFDYLVKPCSADELIMTVERALEHRNLVVEVHHLRSRLEQRVSLEQIMGTSPEIKAVHANVERVANTNFSVLIQGESGTGKEVIARAIHDMSGRRNHEFVAVDCGAIPSTLIESELFGYEKGAFTGADRRKEGLFESARNGTLFLDEIANIPLETQGKLLRALQEKKIMHLGGKQPIEIDIRVICATNLPLDEATKSGKFRLDLFYRLNEFTIYLPPLHKRRDDIVFLTNRFIREANSELGKEVGGISKLALEVLLNYQWPGNVRELKNVIRRAVLMADKQITEQHLFFDYRNTGTPSSGVSGLPMSTLKEVRKHAEKEAIERALQACDGNKSEVSRLLDVDYKTLLSKIKEFNLG